MSIPRILHYLGSKWSMASWIIRHMPEHSTYLETFFGSGAVFFNKLRSEQGTINDIDGNVVNLFRVIRDYPEELARAVQWTPYSREEYLSCQFGGDKNLERGTADDSYRIKQWNSIPDKLQRVAERLKEVRIECRPALDIIKRYKRKDVLIYTDPPNLSETRNGNIYKYEMTDDEHADLLATLIDHPGPVIIFGYTQANCMMKRCLDGYVRNQVK